jgi:hypothetical protein
MKQTAVEWQFEQFFNSFEKFNNRECTFNDYLKRNLEIREQAKEMEKEQMIEFACQVAEASAMKYIQGKTTRMIAEELLTKQQEQ